MEQILAAKHFMTVYRELLEIVTSSDSYYESLKHNKAFKLLRPDLQKVIIGTTGYDLFKHKQEKENNEYNLNLNIMLSYEHKIIYNAPLTNAYGSKEYAEHKRCYVLFDTNNVDAIYTYHIYYCYGIPYFVLMADKLREDLNNSSAHEKFKLIYGLAKCLTEFYYPIPSSSNYSSYDLIYRFTPLVASIHAAINILDMNSDELEENIPHIGFKVIKRDSDSLENAFPYLVYDISEYCTIKNEDPVEFMEFYIDNAAVLINYDTVPFE